MYYKLTSNYLSLSLKIIANAPKSEVKPTAKTEDFLVVKVKGIREKGKANEELVSLLSKHFKVPKSAVEIVKGATSSLKRVQIHSEDPKKLLDILP